MRTTILSLSLSSILLVALSCSSDEPQEIAPSEPTDVQPLSGRLDESARVANIIAANLPASVKGDEPFTIQLKYQFSNGCESFKRVTSQQINATTFKISVEANFPNDPEISCTMDMPEETRDISFSLPAGNTYTLQFEGSSKIQRNVEVN